MEQKRVIINRDSSDDAGQRVFNGFVRILEDALAADAGCFLLLEDDLAFARHFRAAIECWPPLLEKKIGCPQARASESCKAGGTSAADSTAVTNLSATRAEASRR